MSFILSSIKQVRWYVETCRFGRLQIVFNRPGVSALNILATDTLVLSKDTDFANGDYSPFLKSPIPISKKFTTTKGRQALDDVTIQMRDSYGYSGSVDGVPTAELFSGSFLTFFDVWFDETEPYKAFILYRDVETNLLEVSYEGWIDPSYRPSSDPNVTGLGTADQMWLGTATIKITANAKNLTWRDCLLNIGSSDCQDGTPVNGFMYAPPGAQNCSNTRADAFSSSVGGWMLAVPHYHKHNPVDPYLTLDFAGKDLRVMSWPLSPWPSNAGGQGQILGSGFSPAGSSGYAVNDTGTINGSTGTPQEYKITAVGGGGIVANFTYTVLGNGYSTTGAHATTATSGSGTGLVIDIDKLSTGVAWGPSGFAFITVGKLLAKAAFTMGLDTFTPSTDLKSALDFFAQKSVNSGGQQCFPIDTTPIPLDEIYVSLNVLAKSHPHDGSYWDIPAGYSQDTLLIDVVTGLCNSLLSDFNNTYDSAGLGKFNMRGMGEPGIALPATWINQGTPAQEEPATGPRVVKIHNRGDDLVIQSPNGIVGDAAEIENAVRLHRIGQTSGVNPTQNEECVKWDAAKKLEEQADECFKVAWFNENGDAIVNPNCWKGLCYFYWFHAANSSLVYPSNWSPFTGSSWANHFYVVNACYRSGDTPSANLQGEIQGNSYFNTRDYHAVAFAALTLTEENTPQTFAYSGVSDASGSVQAITAGMSGQWRLRQNSAQDWRAVEITQELVSGETVAKFTPVGSGASKFPQLTDLTYGPVDGTGGTQSTTGGNTQTGGVTIPPSSVSWHPLVEVVLTGTGIVSLTTADAQYLLTDPLTTGATISLSGLVAPRTLIVINKTGADFQTGNLGIRNGETWALTYDSSGIAGDSGLPVGWNLFGRSN